MKSGRPYDSPYGLSPYIILSEAVSEQARQYNLDAFVSSGVVEEYIKEPYHEVRRQEAARLLGRALTHPNSPDGPVIEIAAGSQTMLSEADLGRTVIASDGVLGVLKAGVEAQKLKHAICFDASKPWPLKDKSVAGIAAGEYIEHLPIHLIGCFLCEAHRTLDDNGDLVLTVPNLVALQQRWRFFWGGQVRDYDIYGKLQAHLVHFTVDFLRTMLTDFGFEPLEHTSNYVGWELPNGKWIESRRLAKLFPALGGSIIMSARKVPSDYPKQWAELQSRLWTEGRN